MLESTYEECLAYELALRNFSVSRQQTVPVKYKGITVEAGYRYDLLVEDLVIVELKAFEEILPVINTKL